MKILSVFESGKKSILNHLIPALAVLLILPQLAIGNTAYAQTFENDKRSVIQQIDRTTGRINRPARPVKNVIVLIPDGCSLATISLARWYQWLQHPDRPALFIDPYVCGTVRTFSSNAPIGDSAPTTSCYMTGEPSRTGFVSTYPLADGDKDILWVDSTKAYQPMMTVLEASRLVYGKSTGLVFTCEFPHATPADCSAHSYNRGDYTSITSQMVHNKLDVVIGGGVSLLEDDHKAYLAEQGYTVQLDDLNGLQAFSGQKLWSLFGDRALPYDLDRDPTKEPSLEQMTAKAIQVLSTNPNGFFLMVEGSKVDWAAHANDPVGMITDFLAFDRACKKALDFAQKDGQTAVVILSDHGNSGISIGTKRLSGYDKLSKEQLFGNLLKMNRTAEGLAGLLNRADASHMTAIVKTYTDIDLTPAQQEQINKASDYRHSNLSREARRRNPNLQYTLADIMSLATGIGFTTNGHTGEEVLLAAYHPENTLPTGVRMNVEINDYLCQLLSLQDSLPILTQRYFAPHTAVFEGLKMHVDTLADKDHPVLVVKHKRKELRLKDDSSVALLNGKPVQLSSVVVYMDKNKTFYLPKAVADLVK